MFPLFLDGFTIHYFFRSHNWSPLIFLSGVFSNIKSWFPVLIVLLIYYSIPGNVPLVLLIQGFSRHILIVFRYSSSSLSARGNITWGSRFASLSGSVRLQIFFHFVWKILVSLIWKNLHRKRKTNQESPNRKDQLQNRRPRKISPQLQRGRLHHLRSSKTAKSG